jgi:hypothetical protein
LPAYGIGQHVRLLVVCLQVMPSHVVAALQQQLAAAPPAAGADSLATPPAKRRHAGDGAVAGAGAAAAATAAAADPAGSYYVPQQQLPAVRAALRLARYSLARCDVVLRLMSRLATVPESFEMARATGLTLDQVGEGPSRRRQL